MGSLWVEIKCPEHGLERFKIKVIKKYNVTPTLIKPRFRTRPRHELSSIIIGRNVNHSEVRDYLVHYFNETGLMERVLSIRMQV
jgi:hypothetical protein